MGGLHDFCLTIPYGMVVGVGGIIGFATAGSKASLIAGCGSGAALTFCGFQSLAGFKERGSCDRKWAQICLVLSSVLTFVMGKRFQATGKFMPAGLVAAMSVLMSVFYVMKMSEKPPKKSE